MDNEVTRLRALCAAALAAKGSPGAAQVVREVLGALPALTRDDERAIRALPLPGDAVGGEP